MARLEVRPAVEARLLAWGGGRRKPCFGRSRRSTRTTPLHHSLRAMGRNFEGRIPGWQSLRTWHKRATSHIRDARQGFGRIIGGDPGYERGGQGSGGGV